MGEEPITEGPCSDRISEAASAGEEDIITPIYFELRRIAGVLMRGEQAQVTLQQTMVVHEAWLRLAGQTGDRAGDRSDHLALAVHVMRHVIVDHARRRNAAKRGGPENARLDQTVDLLEARGLEPIEVDEALEQLAIRDPQAARIVELRVFAGMTVDETAALLAISPRTVKRDWAMAKAWLRQKVAPGA